MRPFKPHYRPFRGGWERLHFGMILRVIGAKSPSHLEQMVRDENERRARTVQGRSLGML